MAVRLPVHSPNQRIGLYGGSFNPAHQGHVTLARHALKKLKLDHVWWLVSPQNPLKSADETADMDERIAIAENLVTNPSMVITDLERQLGSTCTADTLRALKPTLENGNFVWIMGADSFAELHKWRDWQTIPNALPLAVFDRPGWRYKALSSQAARRFADEQLAPEDAPLLLSSAAPAWAFLPMPLRYESSSAIRAAEKLQ